MYQHAERQPQLPIAHWQIDLCSAVTSPCHRLATCSGDTRKGVFCSHCAIGITQQPFAALGLTAPHPLPPISTASLAFPNRFDLYLLSISPPSLPVRLRPRASLVMNGRGTERRRGTVGTDDICEGLEATLQGALRRKFEFDALLPLFDPPQRSDMHFLTNCWRLVGRSVRTIGGKDYACGSSNPPGRFGRCATSPRGLRRRSIVARRRGQLPCPHAHL